MKRPQSFQESQETKGVVYVAEERMCVIWRNRTAYVSLQCGWQPRALKNVFLSSGEHRHQLRASQEVLKQHLMSQVAVKWALLGKSKKHIQDFGNCHFTLLFLIRENLLWFLTCFLELCSKERCLELFSLSLTQPSWNVNLRREKKTQSSNAVCTLASVLFPIKNYWVCHLRFTQ